MPDTGKQRGGLLGKGLLGGLIKFSGLGAGFIFFLLVAQRTTPEQFGYFAAAFSVATILGFGGTAGQHVAILRFWPALHGKYGTQAAEAAIWPTFRLPLTLAVLTVGGGLLYGGSLLQQGEPDRAATALFCAILALAFTLSEYCVAALRARGMLVFSLAPREILWRLFSCAALFAFAAPMSTGTALAVAAGGLLAATLPQLTLVVRSILSAERTMLPEDERAAIRYATPGLWGVAAAFPITQHATTVVVALALGPVAAGVYFAADKLARLLIIAMYGVNQVAGPRLSRAYHSGDMATSQSISATASNIAVLAALAGFLVYAWIGPFLLGIFDPSYTAAQPVLLVLALGMIVNALSGVNELLLQLTGRERGYFWVVLGWGVGGVALSYVLALLFGTIGAALATALGLAGRSLHAVYLCKRDIGLLTLPSPITRHFSK